MVGSWRLRFCAWWVEDVEYHQEKYKLETPSTIRIV